MSLLSKSPRGVRWWPALLILLGASGVLLWNWLVREAQRQDRYLASGAILIATVVLLLVWVTFLSRLRAALRSTVLALALLTAIAVPVLFRITGVTGDLLPIVEWRWQKPEVAGRNITAISDKVPSEASALPVTNEFPQALGPARNGVIPNVTLATNWGVNPPRELWRRPLGAAWSGFATAGGVAVTLEQTGSDERVTAFSLSSGAPLWSTAFPARYATTIAGEGPRTTPTITEGRVVTLGATGVLTCQDLRNGKVLWRTNVLEASQAGIPDWGLSGSPLVHGGLVIVHPGGGKDRSLVAHRLEDGAFVWGAGDGHAGYSSPVLFTFDGVDQVLIFHSSGVTAHAPDDGKVLWSHPWPKGHPHVSVPVAAGENRLLISSGYGTGTELVEVTHDNGTWAARRVWKTNRLRSKFSNLIVHGEFLYGLDDGIMACLELKSGALVWKDGRYGHGQLLLVGDLLLLTAEKGDVVLVEPNPAGLQEVARLEIFSAKQWNPPALAGDLLLVRTAEEGACYRLPLRDAKPLIEGLPQRE